MLSVVKKVRPIKRGDLQSPYPIDMLATAWGLGIANPQSIKWLGHFLTADNISAGTPNGGKGISSAMDAMEAMLSEQHHDLHVPFLIRPKVTGRIDYRQLFHY